MSGEIKVKKLSGEALLRVTRFHVGAALPPLAQLGGDDGASAPFVAYDTTTMSHVWGERGRGLLRRTLAQLEDSFDAMHALDSADLPAWDLHMDARRFLAVALATVAGLWHNDAARDLTGTYATDTLYHQAKALYERLSIDDATTEAAKERELAHA